MSGLFRAPWARTASPAGTQRSMATIEIFTAQVIGKTVIARAMMAYDVVYGFANGVSSNCSRRWYAGSQ